jgi:nicotinamidase-related amidase
VSDSYTNPDFSTAALIMIDTQRDVLDGGPLEIPGTSAALGSMRDLVDAFRAARRPIVHIVRLYRADGANVDLCRRQGVESGAHVLTPGTAGSQLAPPLLPEPDMTLDDERLLAGEVQSLGPRESAIYKPRWGAFYKTPLEEHLREQGVTTLVFSGCNFPNCPRTSIYEASERVGRALEERGVVAGGDQRRDARVAQDIEGWTRLARRSTAVGTTNGLDDVLGKRPTIRNGRARDPQELTQRRGLRVEAVGKGLVAHALKRTSSGSSGTK